MLTSCHRPSATVEIGGKIIMQSIENSGSANQQNHFHLFFSNAALVPPQRNATLTEYKKVAGANVQERKISCFFFIFAEN